MDKLWAPWRMRYVGGPKRDECVFCAALQQGCDRDALVLHRSAGAFIILNLYPYNSGHAMVVPYEHVGSLDRLPSTTRAELLDLAELFIAAAGHVLHPDGYNLGLNLGDVAGAGVAEHLHVHVVPRWLGDANFMPIVAGVTVMPELLPVTYARLRAEIQRVLVDRAGDATAQAGAVVVLREQRAVVYRRAHNGDIVIPKGRVEPDESAAEAALREVREEVAIDAEIVGWAGSHTFDAAPGAGNGARRHVSFFLATGVPTAAFSERLGRDTVVAPMEQAISALSVPAQREIVAAVIDDVRRIVEGDA